MSFFLAFLLATLAQTVQAPAPVAVVHFELYHNRVYVPVTVNGIGPFPVVLDTGASASGLSPARARELKLDVKGKGDLRGNGESTTKIALAKNVMFKLGDAQILADTIAVIPFDNLESHEGRTVEGILGVELFRRYVVETDYAAHTLTLYEPASFHYSGPGEVIPLKIVRNSTLLLFHATIRMRSMQQIEADMAIDSGTYSAVRLFRPFSEQHHLLLNAVNVVPSSGFGLGGEFQEVLGRMESLQIGPFHLLEPVTSISTASSGFTATEKHAGTIGGDVLRRFKVTLDYSRRQMILEPNAEFEQPYEADMSGLILLAEGPELKTIRVGHAAGAMPGSEAGIHDGDEIVSINDQPAAELGLEKIRLLFQQKADYRLKIRRAGQTLELTMHTRGII